jgi:VanZ family protein
MNPIPSTAASRRLAVVYAVAVVVISSYPDVKLPDVGEEGVDKLLHFAQYAILGFLVSRGWGPFREKRTTGLAPWIVAVLLLLFAGADEFHQHWIPGRSPEFWDWMADALGVLTGFALGAVANRHTRYSRSDA